MTHQSPPQATPQRIPLSVLADTIEARGRAARRWPGNMTPDTVDRIETHCHRGGKVLRLFDEYKDGLRHLIEFLRARDTDARRCLYTDPNDAETAALLSHPAVRPVIEAFPDAQLAGVEPLRAARFANPDGSGAEPFANPDSEPDTEPSEDTEP